MIFRIIKQLGLAGVLLSTAGCGTVGYYSQAINGHLKLMRARQPITQVLASDSTTPELRQQLQTLVEAREFAITELSLPDNDSYSSFVATGSTAVTWNVVAASEFSVRPKTWCFPVAGCVSYRGYFAREDADKYADELAAQNYDVTVGGASAYSTLGWFDDPVLDTMLRGGDTRYVGTLFHELAHQVLYVKGDSNFNEAFATFVQQLGVQRWLSQRGEAERIAQYDESQRRQEEFVDLLNNTHDALRSLYSEDLPDVEMRAAKAAAFDQMRADYETLKSQWGGYSGYDGWFSRDLNNARLVAVSTYRRYVPAFQAMYLEAGENLDQFYEVAKVTAELPAEERQQRLDAYLAALDATR